MAVTKAQIRKIALSFPEANEKPSYGKPAYFVAKKFFTRVRDEDDSIVLIVDSIDEREMMIEADAKTFFITDHYKDYPSVLVRIARVDAKTVQGMLERRWRKIAPKKLVKALASESAAAPVKAKPRKKTVKKKAAKA